MDILIEKTAALFSPLDTYIFELLLKKHLDNRSDDTYCLQFPALRAVLKIIGNQDPWCRAYLKFLENEPLESFEDLKEHPDIMKLAVEKFLTFTTQSPGDAQIVLFKRSFRVKINDIIVVEAPNRSKFEYDDYWFTVFANLMFSKGCAVVDLFMNVAGARDNESTRQLWKDIMKKFHFENPPRRRNIWEPVNDKREYYHNGHYFLSLDNVHWFWNARFGEFFNEKDNTEYLRPLGFFVSKNFDVISMNA